MSRSRKKNPVHSWACCQSERWDKRYWHRKFRRRNRIITRSDKFTEVWPHFREYSDPWLMNKDGKVWCSRRDYLDNPYVRKALRK